MKTGVIIFTILMMVVLPSTAQDRDQIRLEEHLMLKDGKVFRIKDQDEIQLTEQLRLRDGTVVNPDGGIQFRDRDQLRLRDGECIDMDGNRYASQQEFRQNLRSRNQAMAQEHFMMSDGRMYRIQNQQQTQLQERTTLQNGTTVNPNGNVQLRNGVQMQLKNGECLDIDGNRYASQQQFHERMQSRFQAMAAEHIMMENGQMYRIQDQQRVPVQEQITLSNGTKVSPDGTIQRNKSRFQLRDGECIDMEGNRYQNQDRFREKMEARTMNRLLERRERRPMETRGSEKKRTEKRTPEKKVQQRKTGGSN